MAEPAYLSVFDQFVTILKNTNQFGHVSVDEQQGPAAEQCPALLIGVPVITWTPLCLVSGPASSTGEPYDIRMTFDVRAYVFSAQGPLDVVRKRLQLVHDVVVILRNNHRIGNYVVTTDPTRATLLEPLNEPGGANFGQAIVSFESQIRG